MSVSTDRRTDLDWLRIIAFGLLIFYHVGMFYVTWDWHVKSERASDAVEPLMLLTNPWRLTLLFIISGAATRFMADKIPPLRLAGSRLWRLLPPLIFGMFVIVPPQAYYEIVEQIGYAGGWADFYPKYATASGNWCDADGCLITPTWNHLWFVAYLIVYTLAALVLLPLLRRIPKQVGALISGPFILLTPWMYLLALRMTLSPMFGETHALGDDWYVHALSFAAFLFGFGVAKHARFFEDAARGRWVFLALALIGYAGMLTCYIMWDGLDWTETMKLIGRSFRELQAWAAILALFGFAYKHLRNADGPIRRYLTDAIFPFYIVHQTIIIVAGYHLDALALPLGLEVTLVIGATMLGCLLTYEMVRRTPLLRPLFGLKSRSAALPAKGIEFASGGTELESRADR